VSDLVNRLRDWDTGDDITGQQLLMDAADEIERLTRLQQNIVDTELMRAAVTGLKKDNEQLTHDIGRHVTICSKLSTENERLTLELQGWMQQAARLGEYQGENERLRAALAGLVAAVEHMRVPQTTEDAALQVSVTIGPALLRAREAMRPAEEKKT
jgi:FtsZ-binding cell division protein ZapB